MIKDKKKIKEKKSCSFAISVSLLISPREYNKCKGVKVQSTQEKNTLTWHHFQSRVFFLVVEPATDIHTAAVHPRVFFLDIPDGQGHVAASLIPPQLVPRRHSTGHRPSVSLD